MSNSSDPIITLGIETSCDETAAAVYHEQRGLLSNVIFSQVDLHSAFGGVVPEIASRTQLEKITPIVQEAITQSGCVPDEINTVAVTNRPGLPGSLLVGVCFAKSYAFGSGKRIIGVNHLEGHAFSASAEHEVPFPYLCLTASGGHTAIYLVHDWGEYEILGQTVDDAAGEAFDKVAKLLGLPYPGGPEIERLARDIEFQDFCTYPRGKPNILDFSFSGLKTAVLYDLVKRGAYDMKSKRMLKPDDTRLKQEVASSLLVCIGDIFERKLKSALKQVSVKAVIFVGGVACNRYLRTRLRTVVERQDLPFFVPSPPLCTDNGAMIALVGTHAALRGEYSDWSLDIR